MTSLESKAVLITGAEGGLGAFVTKAFLEAGALVAGVSRSINESDFPHPSFAAISAELSDSSAAEAVAAQVVERFGKLDALIHLVGGFAGGQPVADTDDATVDKMLDMNFRSAFHVMRAAVRRMKGGGRIVAIGSRAVSEPVAAIAAYAASKAALISLVRTLAVENRDAGITANVIVPTTIDTPATRAADPNADHSRWTDPRRMANLAVWLVSEEASQVTGAVIPLYGRGV
ncbi:MAG: SDR family NAD(P)-dependent oxidoreductase [Bryobacteraceae bacterium]|nr:SDR family NAD(P)-dependent oxidoreductase [Bryobacteraceae bacterium]